MTRRVAFVMAAALAAPATMAQLSIESAWVRAMPPSQKMTAAYATVTNNGETPLVINGASTPIAGISELHTTIEIDQRMRMVPLDPIALEPGESFEFAPGGPHVMLMRVTEMPEEGSEVELCFEFSAAAPQCGIATVGREKPE